jgi:hypothetical protein
LLSAKPKNLFPQTARAISLKRESGRIPGEADV